MSSPRRGFSLIELVVVIAIITILAALLLAGVQAILKQRPEIANRNDISQLNGALQNFKAKYGFYPPSRVKLCVRRADYDDTQQLDQDSVKYLTLMFPNIDWINSDMYWNGSTVKLPTGNAANKSANGVILEGDQCLVFFLGGIPGTIPNQDPTQPPQLVCQGFSTNPKNPTDVVTTHTIVNPNGPLPDVVGPYYTFNQARINKRSFGYNTNTSTTTPGYFAAQKNFWSYFDAYGKPYLYFSANNRKNGYNTADIIWTGNIDQGGTYMGDAYPVGPVYASNIVGTSVFTFANPDTFQILCAGRDTIYGQGVAPAIATVPTPNAWSANTAGNYEANRRQADAVTNPNDPGNGQDDMSNFYDSHLGVQQ